jgi:hypothetical protein
MGSPVLCSRAASIVVIGFLRAAPASPSSFYYFI